MSTTDSLAAQSTSPAAHPGKRTVLVTGASGYIGGQLVPALLEDFTVRVLTRSPDGVERQAWRDEVDGWPRALAGHVHRAAPFDLALVGWPGGDFTPLPQTTDDLWEQRGLGYLFPGPDGLTWFPPTTGAPIPADLAADLREMDRMLEASGPADAA